MSFLSTIVIVQCVIHSHRLAPTLEMMFASSCTCKLTRATLSSEGQTPDENVFICLCKINYHIDLDVFKQETDSGLFDLS